MLTLDNKPEDLVRGQVVLVVTSKHGAEAMLFWGLSESRKSARVIPFRHTDYWNTCIKDHLTTQGAFWQNCILHYLSSTTFEEGYAGAKVLPYPEELLGQEQRKRYHELKQLLGC